MTKDFRNVGRVPPRGETSSATPDNLTARHRKIVIASIGFASVLFLFAGIWLLSGGPSPIPEDISGFVGFAFIASAMADIVVIRIMRRLWSRMDAEKTLSQA